MVVLLSVLVVSSPARAEEPPTAAAVPADSDGLSDGVERSLGTNAALFDSDNDGIGDSLEVQFGSGAVPGQPGTMGAALGPDPNDPLNPGTPGLGLDDPTPDAPH